MDKDRFRQVLRRMFWIPVAVGATLAIALILEVQVLVNREQWVEHTDEVIAVSQRLSRTTIDEESRLRAFLLTDDSRFLDLLAKGRDLAKTQQGQLEQLISDPEQQTRNEQVTLAYDDWTSWADQAVAKERSGNDAGDIRSQLRGKELMDRYRQAQAEFSNHEEGLRKERLSSSRRTLRFVNLSVIGLCVLTAIALAGFGRMEMRSLSRSFNEALDTSQAHAEEAHAQKEWFRTTLSSIGDAVIATNGNGEITFINPAAENLTGWMAQDATFKPLSEVFRIVNQHTRETVENPVDKVRRLNCVVGLANHTILIDRNGRETAIDDSGAPIFGADGRMIGIVLVFRDVSKQRALEAALQSNERLALAGRLSASIAHEIHNPLDTVGNLLFLLHQETQGQPHVEQLIGMAQREVHRVAETCKNMLSLHRESRYPAPVKVSELLEGVVALIDETIAKGKRHMEIEHGYEGEIEGFAAELRQVLTNVIKNAVEATMEGGTIEISSARIREAAMDGVLIQVIDNGSGISAQMHSKLFSPFATTKQESGTGLGLWVSRSIVERHGGRIRIGDRTDSVRGANVSIFLPLKAILWKSAS